MPIHESILGTIDFSNPKNVYKNFMPSHRPGLYIHIPFCTRKCLYCGFYSVPSPSRGLVSAWLSSLKQEVLHYRHSFAAFDTLYLGGGTPTCLPSEILSDLMEWVLKHLPFSSDSQFFIEANPGDLTKEKIETIKAMGFNRINVGIQSFCDPELKFLGRRHDATEAVLALQRLKDACVESIGIDLIYGLPEQSMDKWIRTLERTISFRPEHISCYELTYEKGTPLWEMKRQKEIHPIDEDTERDFFLMTDRFLEEHGYIHYEISNFAKEERFISRHNIKYWQHVPYLGLGPAAHSFCGSRRWWNVRDIKTYCKLLEQGKVPVEESEVLTDEQILMEYVFLGLRTVKGIDIKRIEDIPGATETIYRLEQQGFFNIKNGTAIPTLKGFLMADTLSSMLLT